MTLFFVITISLSLETMSSRYEITGISCQRCVEKIARALSESEVINATVSLEPPALMLDQPIDLITLQKIVSSAGNYTVLPIDASVENQGLKISNSFRELLPLFVVVAYLSGAVLLISTLSDDFSLHTIMSHFMGGFFVVFSMFKMIDIRGFANAFSRYDIVAQKSHLYAVCYPFLELVLGVGYFVKWQPATVNIVTALIMAIGTGGVIRALASKQTIQCACLGSALNLPMTKVTLIENTIMGAMALAMLCFG